MNPRFFVFGDSHAGTLLRAGRAMALDFAGGSIMAGLYMNDIFFEVEDGRFKMLSKLGESRLAKRLNAAAMGPNLFDLDMPVLSTVGFNAHNFEAQFRLEGLAIAGSPGENFISTACFEAAVEDARRGAIAFYRALRQAGKTVYAVLPPQRFAGRHAAIFKSFVAIMTRHVSQMGVGIVDVRAETTGSDGALLPQFASARDLVHANDAFGEVVFAKFFDMLSRAGSAQARPAPKPDRRAELTSPSGIIAS